MILEQMMRRLSIAVAMTIALGASGAVAFDPADLRKLKGTNSCAKCDLSGADLYTEINEGALRGGDLTEANLTNASIKLLVLWGTDFTGANLTGADLSKSSLKDANLTDANLTGANLSDAILTGANLTNAKLDGVIICGTIMPDGELDNSGCP